MENGWNVIEIFVFVSLVLVFAVSSHKLERIWIGAPIAFTVAGFLAVKLRDQPLGLDASFTHHLGEAVLVILLFHDASTVRLDQLRAESKTIGRLLLIGLPLTISAGYLLGTLLMPQLAPGLVLFLAAALAPTDAALGEATVSNPAVPLRLRSILSVESGLNDGLATPVVLTALAVAAGRGAEPGGVAVEILLGVALGAVIGFGGRRTMMAAQERQWTTDRWLAVASLSLPFIAYLGATLLEANGFIAAFVAGVGYAAAAPGAEPSHDAIIAFETVGDVLGAAVWFLFGAAIGPVVADISSWEPVVFALLSLTALRMIPVAVALLGSGARWPTVLFVGWFGPRGLASLIFALLSIEELGGADGSVVGGHAEVLATIGLAVLLSVLAHGLSGQPLAERYGRWSARARSTN